MSEENVDIVVFGATSFVGQIICQYLVSHHPANGANSSVRWAMAGRSLAKLEGVRKQLGSGADGIPCWVADASDDAALRALCERSRVVLSTVGPYSRYGEGMIKACVESGTDYCDLTGEVQWIYRMLVKYEAQAKQSGARIVNASGFDSIPSDVGVYFLQQQAQAQFGVPCTTVNMRVKAAKGGISGGTAASMIQVSREVREDSSVRKVLANPFVLCTDGQQKPRQTSVRMPVKDGVSRAWLAPFIMEGINSRIVHRTNMLLDYAYGQDFRYNEAQMMGQGAKGWMGAHALTFGVGGMLMAAYFGPTRRLLEKHVIPAPGEGPTPEQQREGFYDIRFFGQTSTGQTCSVKVTGDQDPGYGSTAKMVSEAALCLACDIGPDKNGGFWTPASLMGDALIERLKARAGIEFITL